MQRRISERSTAKTATPSAGRRITVIRAGNTGSNERACIKARLVAAEFAKAGLQPLVGDSYLQEVELIEYRADVRRMGITLKRGGRAEQFSYIKDFIAPAAAVGHDAALNIFQRSDQFPFALHDIPAMWWFTGFHPDYHQTTDTVEKINFTKMEKILKLAYLSGWAFADGASVPRFLAKPQS